MIKLYWCRGKGRDDQGQQNFGDYLSPLIVEMVSQKKVIWSPAKKADLISIGTVLPRVRKAKNMLRMPRSVHIWGTGCGIEAELLPERHYYHCLRGPLTSKQIDGGGCDSYGDPGLLAEQLVERAKEKKYEVGIVAHYLDKSNPGLVELIDQFPNAKIIDVFSPVDVVLKEISQCSMIFSSSLHGLIVSDSYGVPNQWVQFSEKVDPYKFEDYFLSHGVSMEPITKKFSSLSMNGVEKIIANYSRPKLDHLKNTLVNTFPDL